MKLFLSQSKSAHNCLLPCQTNMCSWLSVTRYIYTSDQFSHHLPFVIRRPSGTLGPSTAFTKGSTAAETGVVLLVGTWLRLCAMCALTRCPAAKALQRLSSPASTAAPMIRASFRAFSPGLVGCDPRTPSMSSMADCASRIVPPPSVPTSMDGIETLICRLSLLLSNSQYKL